MIASLPMYQRPELADAHNRYWALIRERLALIGIDSPPTLAQDADEFQTWTDPSLVLSQTCGMPYRNSLHEHVSIVGTPDFALEDCAPGYARSAFVVRGDDERKSVEDFADAVFAYNQDHSQSGYTLPYHHVAALGFWFERRMHSGQHLNSVRAVADGRADIAAIDGVTWRLATRFEAVAKELRVIDWTGTTPGLPYISRLNAPVTEMFDAISAAIVDLGDVDREALGIRGLVPLPADVYLSVENPPDHITAAL